MNPNIQAKDRYRFWNNGMSDKEIQKGFQNLLSYSDKIGPNTGTVQDLSNAAFLRAKTDWLIGLNGTQAVSSKAGFTVNIGRVLDPVENLIVQRELQIRNFKPEQFFYNSTKICSEWLRIYSELDLMNRVNRDDSPQK